MYQKYYGIQSLRLYISIAQGHVKPLIYVAQHMTHEDNDIGKCTKDQSKNKKRGRTKLH